MAQHQKTQDLADVLFGERRGALQHYATILDNAGFETNWWEATRDPGKRAYERYLQLLPTLAGTETTGNLHDLVALHEQATVVDPHLGALLTVQVNLVLGTLLEQHSRSGAVARALDAIRTGRAVGAYCLTEIGHGSDLHNLETTAEYNPDTGGFDLHTPTDTAVKFMPTTAPPPIPGIARFGIVFARLILHDTYRGNYPFLVWMTDTDGKPYPGVTIRPLPEKPGLGMDNALTRFEHVQLPGESLLSHTGARITSDGRLIDPIPADNQVWRAISRVRLGRLCISAMSAAVSRAALSIALEHATQRDIASMAGGRIPLVAVPAHNAPLLAAVAETYLATASVEIAVDAFSRASDEQGPAITDLVSLTKYLTTSTALRVCNETRDRMGAQGVFAHNKIVEYRALRDAAATAEGDSYVIALQAAYRRLSLPDEWTLETWHSEHCDIDTPHAWIRWLGARARYLQHRTLEKYKTTSGNRQERWDSVYELALVAAEAHTVQRAAHLLASRAQGLPAESRTAMENLLTLYAIGQWRTHGTELLPDGPTPSTSRSLRELQRELHESLAPRLPDLIAAFEVPDGILHTAFDTDSYPIHYANALKAS